jgi:hypothetical protein
MCLADFISSSISPSVSATLPDAHDEIANTSSETNKDSTETSMALTIQHDVDLSSNNIPANVHPSPAQNPSLSPDIIPSENGFIPSTGNNLSAELTPTPDDKITHSAPSATADGETSPGPPDEEMFGTSTEPTPSASGLTPPPDNEITHSAPSATADGEKSATTAESTSPGPPDEEMSGTSTEPTPTASGPPDEEITASSQVIGAKSAIDCSEKQDDDFVMGNPELNGSILSEPCLPQDDDNLPPWLTQTIKYLRGVSEENAWQNLVTEFITFEQSGPPVGVSLIVTGVSQ